MGGVAVDVINVVITDDVGFTSEERNEVVGINVCMVDIGIVSKVSVAMEEIAGIDKPTINDELSKDNDGFMFIVLDKPTINDELSNSTSEIVEESKV